MPIELVAELATAHGGNVEVAADMIRMAADHGAHTVKLQSYSLDKINPADPQAEWLKQSHLDEAAHVELKALAERLGLRFLSTPFDAKAMEMLIKIGCLRIKIASSEAYTHWWRWPDHVTRVISYPWGRVPDNQAPTLRGAVTAIPLYPTPLEAVDKAKMLGGWSDHCVGLSACYRAIAHPVEYLEVHLAAPEGKGRITAFDKSPAQIRQLRDAVDDFETIRSGVPRVFRERWLCA